MVQIQTQVGHGGQNPHPRSFWCGLCRLAPVARQNTGPNPKSGGCLIWYGWPEVIQVHMRVLAQKVVLLLPCVRKQFFWRRRRKLFWERSFKKSCILHHDLTRQGQLFGGSCSGRMGHLATRLLPWHLLVFKLIPSACTRPDVGAHTVRYAVLFRPLLAIVSLPRASGACPALVPQRVRVGLTMCSRPELVHCPVDSQPPSKKGWRWKIWEPMPSMDVPSLVCACVCSCHGGASMHMQALRGWWHAQTRNLWAHHQPH